MLGHIEKYAIKREHHQPVSNADLRQQRIYRLNLNACTSARIAQLCGCDMISPLGSDEFQGLEVLQDQSFVFGSCDALKDFLKHDAGRVDVDICVQSAREFFDFR